MLQPFIQLGRYVLVQKIASGGMADVYRAKLLGVEGFEKIVAIKKILPHWAANRDFINMLVDEAKVLLHLNHTNIVQVFELNKQEDTYFIVMEYVDGVDVRTFARALARKKIIIPISLVVHMAKKICQGLQYAHEKTDESKKHLGIVHRDISPQNILLSHEGEVKITDFGIARVVGKTTETITGTLKGKFAYMSPEQALGQKVDARTDIFALGVILFELATGERAFKGENDLETLEAVKNTTLSFDLVRHQPIPQKFKEIVMLATKKKKEDRYSHIAAMKSDIMALDFELNRKDAASELKNLIRLCFEEKDTSIEGSHKTISTQMAQVTYTDSHKKTKILVGRPLFETTLPLISQGDEFKTVLLPKTVLDVPDSSRDKSFQVFQAPSLYGKLKTQLIPISYSFFVLISMLLAVGMASQKSVVSESENPPLQKIISAPGLSLVKSDKPSPTLVVTIPKVDEKGPVETVPVEAKKETPLPDEKKGPPSGFGGVMVSARPWGLVYLEDSKGFEAPWSFRQVPAGEYPLKVVFPPLNKTVSTTIRVAAHATVKCQAVFGEKQSLVCK